MTRIGIAGSSIRVRSWDSRTFITFFLLLCLLLAAPGRAHDEVTPKPKILQNGLPLRRLAGAEGETQTFKIMVPADVRKLVFTSRGGTGDVDLFAQVNVHPTTHEAEHASRGAGTREQITVTDPEPGPWYVTVDGLAEYSGVKLRAVFALKKGAVEAPRMTPPPGVYAGGVSVKLKSRMRKAAVRYTTDGSAVNEKSPAYDGKIPLAQTTTLRTRAFARRDRSSAEAGGDYVIQPANGVTELTSGVTLHHRAGRGGEEHAFRITAPPGQQDVRFFTNGGTGKTELLVKRGSRPTTTDFDAMDDGKGNAASVIVDAPEAGEWFAVLRGRRSFSGVSVMATVHPNLPDLIAWQPALEPYLSVETFTGADCEVQENLIEAGTHRLLRFSTESRNIGGVDLAMPDPAGNPDFEFAECHGHYHFKGFASYRLIDAAGGTAALGRKVSFCLLDVVRWDPNANARRIFSCERQGIQAGWADVYDGGLPGQWIDVTAVPAGVYTLEVVMNPEGILAEANYDNNTETIEVTIPPAAAP